MALRQVYPIGDYSHLNVKHKHQIGPASKHMGGDLPCVIDTETTGIDPFTDSIWEIAIIPLDRNWLPDRNAKPFYCMMRPKIRIEAIDFNVDVNAGNRARILQAYNDGFDSDVAADLFMDWFKSQDILPASRIQPLGHGVGFDISMIQAWLNPDTYAAYFSHRVRDTLQTEMFLDDHDVSRGKKIMANDYRLKTVAARYGVVNHGQHNALCDAITTAEVYSNQVRVQALDM